MTYDNFENGTLNAWTTTQTTGGTVVNSTSAAKFGSRGCRCTTDGAGDNQPAALIKTGMNTRAVNIYTWIRSSNVGASMVAYFYLYDTETRYICSLQIAYDKFYYEDYTGSHAFTAATASDNTWYRLRINCDLDAKTVSFYIYDANNNLIDSALNKTPTDWGANIDQVWYWAADSGYSSFTVDFDNTCYSNTEELSNPPIRRILDQRGFVEGDVRDCNDARF